MQLKTHIYTCGSKARYEKMDLKFVLPIIIKCRCHHLSNPSSAPARTKRESKKKVQYDQLSKKKIEYDQKKQA